MKVCNRCGEEKPLSEYYNNNASKDKKQSICKSCTIEISTAAQKRTRPYRHEQFNRGKRWTEEDMRYLIENIDKSNEELGYKLGRSWSTINTYKSKINKKEISIEDYKERTTRKCKKCNTVKSIDDFYYHDRLKGYRQWCCKECHNKIVKRNYAKMQKETKKTKPKRHNEPWTVKEVLYVKNNLNKDTKELANELGRSYFSIMERKKKIAREMKERGEYE